MPPTPLLPRRRLAPDAVFPAGRPGHEASVVALGSGERVRVVRCRPTLHGREAVVDAPPVVVCVHGWGCSAYSYNKNLRPLADAGFDVVAPDVRGHGWSDKPLEQDAYTPDALGRWLLDLLDALDIRRAVLVGHSMGGAVVMRAALADAARVAGLVLLAPVGFGDIPRTRLLRLLTPPVLDPLYTRLATRATFALGLRMGYGRLGRPSDEDVDEYWAATSDPKFVQAARRVAHAFDWAPGRPEDLARLTRPVHVLLGERDNLVSPAIARRHVAQLPNARLDEIDGAGHVLSEEVPHVVERAIIEDVAAWW